MTNYYNEFDPKAAAGLKQLIVDGLIPHGEVDERSISEVTPGDLAGFTQCHFFAGIGGWSRALQIAGWDPHRPVWTGSCPCQPYSTAGSQEGAGDDRHLWPTWLTLIRECRPPEIYGEQVASAIAYGWLDDVCQGLEAENYACAAAVLPAVSVGAPHKRDRLWFVAHAQDAESQNACEAWRGKSGPAGPGRGDDGDQPGRINPEPDRPASPSGFWGDAQWIGCPDGRQRLVKPGIRLLADGVPERVGLLSTGGNAIVPEVAARFIMATM